MNRLLVSFERVFFAIAVIALVLMIAHVTLEVCLRLLGTVSQLQTITFVSAWYMVAVIFCALPYAQRHEGHISVDIFTSMLPSGVRSILARLVSLVSAIYLALLGYLSVREAWQQTIKNEIWETSSGYIIVWPGRWAIAVAFVSLALFYALRFLHPSTDGNAGSDMETV